MNDTPINQPPPKSEEKQKKEWVEPQLESVSIETGTKPVVDSTSSRS